MPNPVIHFEIPADNIGRAIGFYQKTFGWQITEFPLPQGESYWLVGTTEVDGDMKPTRPGEINGGLMKRNCEGQPFVNYIGVDSIDAMCETIEANGGKIVMPKQEIAPGMGWIALFKDTEGNLVGLGQMEGEK